MMIPLLRTLIDVYSLLLFGAVILSWLNLDPSNPIARFLRAATEPVLEPVRKILPSFGGLDLSPMIVLLVLRALSRGLAMRAG